MTDAEQPITETVESKLMSWADLTTRPQPSPTESIRVGIGATDIVDLWIPEGKGLHPTVIMIHGGCWQKAIADRTLMNYAAEDLRQKGLAVWNIEYRGVDEEGGGYPGTFQDVAKAIDALPALAEKYNLRADKIVAYGHSAGGHLATWASLRGNLDPLSPTFVENPTVIHAVINSGGLADLKASTPVTLQSCLAEIVDDLTGPSSATRPDVFSDTSPAEMFPGSTFHISVNGDKDRIAPPELGIAYTKRVMGSGMKAQYVEVPDTGHVELIAPDTDAFDKTAELLIEFFD